MSRRKYKGFSIVSVSSKERMYKKGYKYRAAAARKQDVRKNTERN